VDAAWEAQQLADAAAGQQWNAAATAADSAALDAAKQDVKAADAAEISAWQNQADAILTAEEAAVHAWAQQSGTNYAHLQDVETAAWISGTESDVAADATDAEANFNDQTNAAVADAEAGDAEANAEAAAAQTAVHTETDAAVADAHDQAQAVVAEVASADTAWQTDENAAAGDAAATNTDEAAAAVTDANAVQTAADAWEQTEAPAAAADQKAVAAADDQASHAQDAATHTGNDAIAADAKTQENHDATAAQTHDTNVASAVHTDIVNRAQAIDAAVNAQAAQALADVQAAVQNLPADITAAVNAQVADAHAKNADYTALSISLANAARAALTEQVTLQAYSAVVSAQQKSTTDAARALNDPVITQVNPPPPQTWFQYFADYVPPWQTVATIGAFAIVGTAALLIPGAGPVLLVAGLGLLAGSIALSAADRFFYQNQTLAQSLGGGLGDGTGVGALWTGFIGTDFGTGRHLGLTNAQQRQLITQGTIQTASTALLVYGAAKGLGSFGRGGAPTAVGESLVTEDVCPCFAAGTRLLTREGWRPIETLRVGDLVWARSESDPDGAGAWKRVEQTFVHPAPVKNLHVGEQVIRVTVEHPFWVRGEGWKPTGALAAGDALAGKDGEWILVEAVTDAGEVTTVYNVRVEEYHTYFVGGEDWGFSVWSHNVDCVFRGLAAGEDPAAGLTARAPGAGNSVVSHIAGKDATQWISTTTQEAIARTRFGQNGVVEIDLSRVNSEIVDVSKGLPGMEGTMLSNWAAKFSEVLVKDFIPPEAIKLLP